MNHPAVNFVGTNKPESGGALVLIAEDEPEIVEIIKAYLHRDGMRTAHAKDGRAALELHLAIKPDLVLLDVKMPHVDGWQVLSELRRRGNTPVIMLTSHDQDIDKLIALRVGADDYVVKPFNPAEVAARALAVLRRTGSNGVAERGLLRCGPIEVNLESHQAHVLRNDAALPLSLTLTEFRLLAHMARTPARVHSRAELLVSCLPEGDSLERTVDSHISKLRKKLEAADVPHLLVSLRGVGYCLKSPS
ncbi:response regulator transcription factor [Undibacterium sp. FT147W]|uniref:Response regulator transcription factor n=1 Tax=Undibacterium rivi TaxID=2828729 RepID=A0ABS5H611_9BURK|nr:response regulator [Undibacterium rivi]MBR7793859.1 response regulator transcription factor [Undibacterium rivi]